MNYTKQELKNSINNKTDRNTKVIRVTLLVIFTPLLITICIVKPGFIGMLLLLLLLLPKTIAKKFDVEFGLVDIDDFLVLGSLSNKNSEYYAWDNKKIHPVKYDKFFMSDYFLNKRTNFKNGYLNHHIVKINGSRLKNCKELVDIFDFTLMDMDRLEIFEHIREEIFKDGPYKRISVAEKVFKKYLKQISKIYDGTRVVRLDSNRYQRIWRIKNIEKHLNEKPRDFINFVMYEGYELPTCHRYSLDGEKLETVTISESDFAKMIYLDVLEVVKQSYKV